MATAPAVIGGTTPSHLPAERGLRPANQVSLRVLGRFELHVDGRRHEVPWQAQRVLGYLAVGGVAQPRATVAGALWEDVSQRRAQANLRNAVWRVRQLSDGVLAGGRDVIALDGRVALDLRDAQRRAQALLRDDDDTAADVAGIDLLDDDLLPTWDEPWLLIERERQRQLRMHALERLSASLLRAERYPQAITVALAAVQAEPLRESSQRALIAAHLAEGNISEAMRQLDAYRALLRAELGIAPSQPLESMVAGALEALGA
jgi:DNA-binding SARP family transcriptional activator